MSPCLTDEIILKLLRGVEDTAERHDSEEHLALCEKCRSKLDELQISTQRLTMMIHECLTINSSDFVSSVSDAVASRNKAEEPSLSLLRRRPKLILAGAGISLLLILVLLGVWLRPSKEVISIVSHVVGRPMGSIGLKGREEIVAFTVGTEIVDRAEITTGSKDRIVLDFSQAMTQIFLNTNSHVRVLQHGQLEMEHGEVWIEVNSGAEFLTIETPHSDIVFTGAKFMVEVEEYLTSVTVIEGTITIMNQQGSVEVPAGHRSSCRPGAAPLPSAVVIISREPAWTRSLHVIDLTNDDGDTSEWGGSVVGVVVDEYNAPITNVTVTAWNYQNPVLWAITDTSGQFVFDNLYEGYYNLTAQKENLISYQSLHSAQTVRVSKGITTFAEDLVLQPAASVSGTVLSRRDGTSISEARVGLRWSGFTSLVPETRTDSNGQYLLQGIPSGKRQILVEAATYAAKLITVEINSLGVVPVEECLLTPEVSLTGRVIDTNGEPISGVRVYYSAEDTAPDRQTETDSDGVYQLDGLDYTLPCHVTARHKDYLSESARGIVLSPGPEENRQDFVLEPSD